MSIVPTIQVNLDNVPEKMKSYRQWMLWKYFTHDPKTRKPYKKPSKRPIQPNGRLASYKTPDHYLTFEQIKQLFDKNVHSGIGFVLTDKDPFVGVDMDDCADELGFLNEESEQVIESLSSYAEMSPSGRGIHVLVEANLPGPGRIDNKNGREMYDSDRFLTFTGCLLGDQPQIVKNQDRVDDLYEIWFESQVTIDVQFGDYEPDKDAEIVGLDDAPCDESTKKLIRSGDGMAQYDEDRSTALFDVCRDLLVCGLNIESVLEILTDSENYLAETALDRRSSRDSAKEWLWKYSLGKQVAILEQQREQLEDDDYESDLETQVLENLKKPSVEIAKLQFSKKCFETNGRLCLKYVCPIASYRKEFFIYDGMAYATYDKERIERDVQKALSGRGMTMNVVDQTIKYVCRSAVVDNFTPHKTIITFPNGCLDLQGWRQNMINYSLIKHDRKYNALGTLPFDYDPSAKCPTWVKFLNTAMENDPERIGAIQEMLGYLLVADTSIQAIMVFANKSRAGKGVIVNDIIPMLVGQASYAATNLNEMAGQFGLEDLDNKKVAVIADAKHAERGKINQAMEKLLNISGSDNLPFQKKHKGGVTKQLTSRLIMTCNQIPVFADDRNALLNRYVIIPFNVSFAGREDSTLPRRLKREIAGIFNWAVEGLVRLGKRGRFQEPKAARKIRSELMLRQNHNGYFLNEFFTPDANAHVSKSDAFANYLEFCNEFDQKSKSRVWFYRSIYDRFDGIEEVKIGSKNDREKCLKGLRFEEEKFQEFIGNLL